MTTVYTPSESERLPQTSKPLGKLRQTALALIATLGLVSGPVLAQETDTGGATGDQIKHVLGLTGEDLAGDVKIQIGMILALTGPGSFFGRIQANGAKLAVAQIKAAGGPDIELVIKDHKSADAQAGARSARELGIAGVPTVFTSYAGVIGSTFPSVAQYKMLALDGGGGTSDFGQGKPYFWGTRAIEPDDAFIGALKYWQANNPEIKKVSFVFIDQGPINEIVQNNFTKAATETGHEVASFEVTTIGATDYSATIARLKATKPDAIFMFLIGVDTGYFMKQYVSAGLTAVTMGAEYVPDAAPVAGPAFDNYMFAIDWYNARTPTNDWAVLFNESYSKRFSELPEINAANYYEDTFVIWDLIRRIKAKGGTSFTGEALQDELMADPNFKSLYGGNGAELGSLSLDTTTHTVTTRPLGVYKYNAGEPVQVAKFDLGGANFELMN